MAKRKPKPEPEPELVCSWCGNTPKTIKRYGGGEIKITVEVRLGVTICNTCLNGIQPAKSGSIAAMYAKDDAKHTRWEQKHKDNLGIVKVVVCRDENGPPQIKQPRLGKSEPEKKHDRTWNQFLKEYEKRPDYRVQRFPNSPELDEVLKAIRDRGEDGRVTEHERMILDKHSTALISGKPIL